MGNLCSSGFEPGPDGGFGAGAASGGAAAGAAAPPPARPMRALGPNDYYAGVNCYYLMVCMACRHAVAGTGAGVAAGRSGGSGCDRAPHAAANACRLSFDATPAGAHARRPWPPSISPLNHTQTRRAPRARARAPWRQRHSMRLLPLVSASSGCGLSTTATAGTRCRRRRVRF